MYLKHIACQLTQIGERVLIRRGRGSDRSRAAWSWWMCYPELVYEHYDRFRAGVWDSPTPGKSPSASCVADLRPARSWHGLWSNRLGFASLHDHHKPCQDRADANARVWACWCSDVAMRTLMSALLSSTRFHETVSVELHAGPRRCDTAIVQGPLGCRLQVGVQDSNSPTS